MPKREADGTSTGGDGPPEKVATSGTFFVRLKSIAEQVTDEKLKSIKDLCHGKIPARMLEKLNDPFDLFKTIYDMDFISSKNTSFLWYLLKEAGLARLTTDKGNNSDNVGKLRESLQDMYMYHFSQIQPIPWNDDLKLQLREVLSMLSVKEVRKGELHAGDEIKNLQDIFKVSIDKEHALRIKIEGRPAIGKSTLCKKLAYDWACGALSQYKLLFFLQMKHVTKQRITDAIFEQLFSRGLSISKEELELLISENGESILFLFDGLDEIDKSFLEKTEIPDQIRGKLRQHCTTIVTTRPSIQTEYLEKCDMHLVVQGFTEEYINQYISKYFEDDPRTGKDLITEIRKQNAVVNQILMSDILKSPLHVSFLCILWEDYRAEGGGDFPRTLAGLYSEVLCCILRRYCVKNDINIDSDVIPENVTRARDELAFDAYKVYMDNRSDFQKNDLSYPKSLELGLLVCDRGHSRAQKEENELYYFYHKTWLEYFTALHASRHMSIKNRDILGTFLDEPSKSHPVLKFLSGIADESTSKLIFEEFDRKINTMRQQNISADQLSELNGVFLECLHISQHSEKCIEKLVSLPKSLIYFGHEHNTKIIPMPRMCLYEPQCDYEDGFELSKDTCRFDCVLNLLKLKHDAIDNFRLQCSDVTDVSALAQVCKERQMSLKSLVVFCKISDSQEFIVDRVSDMIKLDSDGFKHLESLRVYLHVQCRKVSSTRLNKGLKTLFSRVASRKDISHFALGVDLQSTDIDIFKDCFKSFNEKGPPKVSFLVKTDNSHSLVELKSSISMFILQNKNRKSIEVAFLTPDHESSSELNIISAGTHVECLGLFDGNLLSNSESLNTLINSKETPAEISIGKFSNATFHKACEIVRENRYMRSLTLLVEAPIDDQKYKYMIESLRGNLHLKKFAITYVGLILYSDKLVDCLLDPLKEDIESNTCTLESITCTWEAMSKGKRQGIVNFLPKKGSNNERNWRYNIIKHYGYGKYQHILRYTLATHTPADNE